jgi:hypothetical protein
MYTAQVVKQPEISVVDSDPENFGPLGSGSVIICTKPNPAPYIIKQKKLEKP